MSAAPVVITESISNPGGARILHTGEGEHRFTAVQHPATRYRSESWHIVARIGMPAAEVYCEEAAREWLQYLASMSGAIGGRS
ncbi:MAG: hypothetical protein WBB07_23935 [Mycobacterium sp.]